MMKKSLFGALLLFVLAGSLDGATPQGGACWVQPGMSPQAALHAPVTAQNYFTAAVMLSGDASIEIPEIITISLIRILCECLDNVYKHANANRIDINIQILSDQISVHINDNGIGIDKNYSHTSPWNSGLHRIQELIYLLNGQLKIDGDIISGTDIRFSIPIEIM